MTETRSPDSVLAAHHRYMLEVDSGIRPEVITARGYRTVTVKAELKRLGFSDYQCRVPALLLPVFTLSGEIATFQTRPDQPRIKGERVIKYETPGGTAMALDVLPVLQERVRDVREPLFITEGIKKADAAISHDLCCVALLGVWNWRGTDEHGGKRLLADFERIPWNDRAVSIVFDSDLLEKDQVAHALLRLGNTLAYSFGASVRVVRLPIVPPVPAVPPLGEEGAPS